MPLDSWPLLGGSKRYLNPFPAKKRNLHRELVSTGKIAREDEDELLIKNDLPRPGRQGISPSFCDS